MTRKVKNVSLWELFFKEGGRRKYHSNKMGNNEEAQEERCFSIETLCYGEALATFKAINKCMMNVRPWQ